MGMTWEQLNDQLFSRAVKRGIPVSGQFELTARCNQKCKMCYVCKSAGDSGIRKRELSAKEWIRLAEEVRDAGTLYLLLTGGEVFLRSDFRDIYKEISMMGFNTTIYTNGTLIKSGTAKWLGQNPPSKVEITLYGMSPQTYGKVCGFPEGYSLVLNGINQLISQGIKLKLRTTVIQDNLEDIDSMIEFAQKRKLEFGFVNYVSPRRDEGDTCPESVRLSPEKQAELEEKIYSFYRGADVQNSIPPVKENNSKKEDGAFLCSAGRGSYWVTWDGRMTPCSLMPEPAAFPLKDGFASAWSNLHHICSDIPRCSECSHCSLKDYCMACPARLKNETGFYDKPALYLCRIARRRKGLKEHFKDGTYA